MGNAEEIPSLKTSLGKRKRYRPPMKYITSPKHTLLDIDFFGTKIFQKKNLWSWLPFQWASIQGHRPHRPSSHHLHCLGPPYPSTRAPLTHHIVGQAGVDGGGHGLLIPRETTWFVAFRAIILGCQVEPVTF